MANCRRTHGNAAAAPLPARTCVGDFIFPVCFNLIVHYCQTQFVCFKLLPSSPFSIPFIVWKVLNSDTEHQQVLHNQPPPPPTTTADNVFRYSNKAITKLPDMSRFMAVFSYYQKKKAGGRGGIKTAIPSHKSQRETIQTWPRLAHCHHFWSPNKLRAHFPKWKWSDIVTFLKTGLSMDGFSECGGYTPINSD